MAMILFWVVVAKTIVFVVIAGWSVRTALGETLPRVRTLAWALAVAAGAFAISGVTRLALIGVRLGWLEGEVGEILESEWVLVQSVSALLLGVGAVVLIRRVGRSLRQTERLVATLSNRLGESLSLEGLGLTRRELDVLKVLAEGKLSNQEIAEELFISPATAATHVRNILRKSGMRSRRELALVVHSDGR